MRLAVVTICWKVSCGRTQVQGVAATDVVVVSCGRTQVQGVAAMDVVVADKIADASSGLGSRGLLQQALLLLAVPVSGCW